MNDGKYKKGIWYGYPRFTPPEEWLIVCAGGALNYMMYDGNRGWLDATNATAHNIIISHIDFWMLSVDPPCVYLSDQCSSSSSDSDSSSSGGGGD